MKYLLLLAFVLLSARPEANAQIASATLLDYVVVELRHIESTPFRDPDRTVRLSARDLKFRVRIYSDQWPLPGSAAGAGLAALPQPLAGLAAVLPAASPYAPILASLAAAMAPPPPSPGSGPAVIHIDAGMNRLPTSDTDADIVARQNL